ncbi:UDP-N-acetylmuramate dehydrogenase [Prolixibacter denitrificans]|uniref:UDP-N-acetylenolpyruvoylglucosamine reductase n=1 Tax=Prolixibacter denitrificans TaxID=1541063 RepID=A0A2P8C9R7_9BACT|nr:UDP-N-acetylmuramate dehydrogenase [Prolixibacter denitrificans]PSK81694.1 UDP-N-acetylmuramate dehydrogenase [Prolixibacter denitrificans]GET21217.1 UDP-N-acetylenolpyruvoylglucosamine reductase [Prolixibacter denitrificans]
MFILYHDYSLLTRNTFGIDVKAKSFLSFSDAQGLIQFYQSNPEYRDMEYLIVGGGSNMLFLHDVDELVLSSDISGIEILKEDKESVWVEAGAGIDWDEFVAFCVGNRWGGVENLSLIPGKVGAAPVQNIGAYGVEVGSVIREVRGVDLQTLQQKSFTREMCQFSYRNSIFKQEWKGRFAVTSVVFELSKKPEFRIDYGDVAAEVERLGKVSHSTIRRAVIAIRERKLPDPEIIGNAGSFFKNPVVEEETANALKAKYPEIPLYPAGAGKVKIAAAWLIEKAGWKGKRVGQAGVHDRQALVLVNHGGATGQEIFDLSEQIRIDVENKFAIQLEREVNVIG